MVRMSQPVVTPEGAELDPAGATADPQDGQHEDAATPAPEVPEAAAEVDEVVTWPEWGPPPVDLSNAISVGQLELAQFYGTQNAEQSPAQPHVKRLEDWLRSHAIGGSTRKSEGYYGLKTGKLVQAAYAELLPDAHPSTIVGADLAAALKAKGAPLIP